MLTSFFSNSRPANFIMVSLYLIFGLFFYLFFEEKIDISFSIFSQLFLSIIAYLFLIFLINFIIRKNNLTKTNSYSIIIFSVLMLLFPAIFHEKEVVVSNIFLLLALRRVVSLPSGKNTQKKIFDASIWIAIATIFYFWSILFFIVLFIIILKIGPQKGTHFLIPFVGFITVFVLTTVYYLLTKDNYLWFLGIDTSVGFEFSTYLTPSLFPSILFIIVTLIAAFIQNKLNKSLRPLKEKLLFTLLLVSLLIGFLIITITPNKNGSEFMFLFPPFAIFTAILLERTPIFWVKEAYLWLAVFLPFLIYML